MIIPAEKIEIPNEKLTDYLLVHKTKNDKSSFLEKLGYTVNNWDELKKDILELATHNEAKLQLHTEFGDMYEIKGKLKNFGIVTIWLLAIDTDKYKFVTLFPD